MVLYRLSPDRFGLTTEFAEVTLQHRQRSSFRQCPHSPRALHVVVACLVLALAAGAEAQPYSIAWYTVDGGGHGPITGGVFSLQGTTGQPDASGALAGGVFSVTGGYWTVVGPSLPVVSSPSAGPIAAVTATLGGDVTSDGGSAILARGFVYSVNSTNPDPLIAGSSVTNAVVSGTTGAFSANLASLLPGTTYAFKAYATNSVGAAYTSVATFTTLVPPGFQASTARTLSTNATSRGTLSSLITQSWYRARLFANRSYQISAWPVDHEQGVDAAVLSVDVFSDDAGTVPAAGVSGGSGALEGTANQGGDGKPFTAIIQPTVTGVYKIRAQRLSGGGTSHTVNLMIRETTLFSPWTSRAAGFEGFIEMHNNTNAPVSVTLRAFDAAGVLQGAGQTLTLQPNATEFRTATQVGVPVNIFAGIVLTHDGAVGAVSANITTLNGANGLSFDSPFGSRDPSTQAGPSR